MEFDSKCRLLRHGDHIQSATAEERKASTAYLGRYVREYEDICLFGRESWDDFLFVVGGT